MLDKITLLRKSLGLPPSPEFIQFSQNALLNVPNTSLPDSVRIQQLGMLELLPFEEKKEVLFDCIRNNQPHALQEGALRQLSNYQEEEIGQKIVEVWNELSPTTRRYASDLLVYVEAHHDALLTALEQGKINIGEMNFDLERRRMLLRWTDNIKTRERAQALFTDAGVNNREQALESMHAATELSGSAIDGEKIFLTVCSNCHKYGAIGTQVGPALTEINRKSKATLLHDILDPNAAVDPKYINHLVETHDGAIHTGIVSAETDVSVTIQKIGGEKITIPKSEIASFRSLGSSLMMEGLENTMSVQQMADLLTFLQEGNSK